MAVVGVSFGGTTSPEERISGKHSGFQTAGVLTLERNAGKMSRNSTPSQEYRPGGWHPFRPQGTAEPSGRGASSQRRFCRRSSSLRIALPNPIDSTDLGEVRSSRSHSTSHPQSWETSNLPPGIKISIGRSILTSTKQSISTDVNQSLSFLNEMSSGPSILTSFVPDVGFGNGWFASLRWPANKRERNVIFDPFLSPGTLYVLDSASYIFRNAKQLARKGIENSSEVVVFYRTPRVPTPIFLATIGFLPFSLEIGLTEPRFYTLPHAKMVQIRKICLVKRHNET